MRNPSDIVEYGRRISELSNTLVVMEQGNNRAEEQPSKQTT